MSALSRQQRLKAIISDTLRPVDPIPTQQPARLHTLSDIRWVVFDIYGTVLTSAAGEVAAPDETGADDCESSLLKAFQMTAARYGCGTGPKAGSALAKGFYDLIETEHLRNSSIHRVYPEVDIRSVWEKAFFDQKCPSLSTDNIEEAALRFELAVNPVWPMPNAARVFRQLKIAGYQLGIVSNAQFYTPLVLETLLQDTLENLGFSVTVWSYEIGTAKPSLSLFHRFLAAARHSEPGLSARNILYIGNDMRNDVDPARKLGFRTALFAGDKRSLRLRENDLELESVRPDVVLTDLRQITDVVAGSLKAPAAETVSRKGS